MRAGWLSFCLMVGLFVCSAALAQSAKNYVFDDAAKEATFRELIGELRCPKCQNQSIADSNAELAVDLRERTYQMVQEGASKQEVIDYMVARYGDFVHYQPPVTVATSILWWGPLGVLIIGGIVVVLRVRQQRHREVEWSAEEQAQLDALRQRQKGENE
ncbi:cytochrome c-type biogenesis protein CcmH [Pseudidiomarina sediminum]|uniref:Cytochrome c-type biogenesis protein n=1 Tax=Pseudidiomarina sediminum TaxID=431675 RepID=A0A432Z934_9GAMM|nr:cytochrome c-type biogenesis protein [Pseudidiomarina sediminum]RUO74408.1 cytochrome c-type biogenesis protein CcmH [Pseudidiomarina sediminum]